MPVSFIGQRKGGGEERKTIIFQISPGMATSERECVNLLNRGAGLPRQVITYHYNHKSNEKPRLQSQIFNLYAYLTYMQSTSCKMPGWMKHKLESRLPGGISITSDSR